MQSSVGLPDLIGIVPQNDYRRLEAGTSDFVENDAQRGHALDRKKRFDCAHARAETGGEYEWLDHPESLSRIAASFTASRILP